MHSSARASLFIPIQHQSRPRYTSIIRPPILRAFSHTPKTTAIHSRPHHLAISTHYARSFSSTPTRAGGRAAGNPYPKLAKQTKDYERLYHLDQSVVYKIRLGEATAPQIEEKEGMRKMKLPEDVGLFDGTLIMKPTSELKKQARCAWKRVKDFITILYYKVHGGRPWRKLRNRQIKPTALALHKQLYNAFADGDKQTLSRIAVEGIRYDMYGKIGLRQADETYQWILHKYLEKPKIVSHRASVLPDEATNGKSAIRQAVVRIRSVQSLVRTQRGKAEVFGKEKKVPAKGTRKSIAKHDSLHNWKHDITEYMVLQQRTICGKMEPWKIWGTTEETSWKNFEAALNPSYKKE